MSERDGPTTNLGRDGAGVAAALAFAAVATSFVAPLLPLRFRAPPNRLGIVSWATLHDYPSQQEVVWYVLSLVLSGLAAWAIARRLATRELTPSRIMVLEALAAAAVLARAGLALPAALALALLAAGAGLLVVRSAPAHHRESAAGRAPAGDGPWPRRGVSALLLAVVALALTPGFFDALHDLVARVPDQTLASAGWGFQAEWGQFLVWADALARGGVQGRDFYCLYGPLYPLGAAASWELLGRSVAAWELYFYGVLLLLGLLAALGCAASQMRRRWLACLLPLLVLPIALRLSAGLAGLACLVHGLAGRRRRWLAAAGAIGGFALFFSQEFGLAFLLCAALALALHGRRAAALAFAGGFAAPAIGTVAWLARRGGLGPTLHDLMEYPLLVAAGFGKLPFPAPLHWLPLHLASAGLEPARIVRLGVVSVGVCAGAVLIALGIETADVRRPMAYLRALQRELALDPRRLAILLLGLYGLVAFRSALGRSAFGRVFQATPPAAILLLIGLDRALDRVSRGGGSRLLGAWRAAALAGLAWLASLPTSAAPVVTAALQADARLATGAPPQRPDAREVVAVTRWLNDHAGPEDRMLFLPNAAAYYYLLDRPDPIRFALGHQMVTDAHRAEALAALQAHPPRWLVWAPQGPTLDGIPHERYLGPALVEWLHRAYRVRERIGSATLLELRAPEVPPGE